MIVKVGTRDSWGSLEAESLLKKEKTEEINRVYRKQDFLDTQG